MRLEPPWRVTSKETTTEMNVFAIRRTTDLVYRPYINSSIQPPFLTGRCEDSQGLRVHATNPHNSHGILESVHFECNSATPYFLFAITPKVVNAEGLFNAKEMLGLEAIYGGAKRLECPRRDPLDQMQAMEMDLIRNAGLYISPPPETL
ncbi:hypothetical protein CIHG_07240 [Coccidioides immitis H538.4]|uniref:Uncharacterized protein n=3 Tax=Coccidioides immitis TaxID=5501 RepID=A0A0J8R855_COCIT|nr:hypothetical protein CIRG_09146 [Coccidioides immitis RMSCC 2394]KMU81194.1 hypothetical protein CISG_02571 [Coccidioides immitis RMSCC 3703]KMU89433.1 hypothetical protein CIHG_07240 [Coccidioides immitis H538.4]